MNRSELIVGAVLGFGFFWAIGWWCLPLAFITSVLWAMGGAGIWGTKAWRRFGVPTAILLSHGLKTITFISGVAFVLSVVALSMGYGQRDQSDAGSPLGNFWLDRLGEKWGMIASRATIIIGIWVVWFTAYKISF